jgi:G3E family GTPase
MDLLVFSGFLGSGKTTLVLALAKELAAQGRRTAFIVNEVGEVGVDQQVLRDDGLQVYEITSGCICCQLGVDLVKTLEALVHEQRPENVIVEASGVATPDGVLDALSYYRGPSFASMRSVGVLDPTRLEALLEVMTPLLESQVAGVDGIVITKTDVATGAEVQLAREVVRRLNPSATLATVAATDPAALARLARSMTEQEPVR